MALHRHFWGWPDNSDARGLSGGRLQRLSLGRVDLAKGIWQSGTCAAKDCGNAFAGCTADEEAFSVLLDLGFGQCVEIAADVGPLGVPAGGVHAAAQFALQDQGENGAEDMAANNFLALVVNLNFHPIQKRNILSVKELVVFKGVGLLESSPLFGCPASGMPRLAAGWAER